MREVLAGSRASTHEEHAGVKEVSLLRENHSTWCSVVCAHWSINPRPAGPLDFPPPAGGGRLNAPPMISAPGRRREKRKAAFESSRKIILKSFRSFFCSGQNWGLQGSKFQNFPKRFFDNKIFNFKDRATNLIPLCLSR